jgi:hypothetical protein
MLGSLRLFFTCLDAFELDMLPFWKIFRPRALAIYLRRWREILEAVYQAVRVGVLRKTFSYINLYPLVVATPKDRP